MTRRVILDTSSNNGRVNFAALKAAHPELAGVIVKATEGSGYVNPLFNQQVADAKAAGMLIGAYAFAHPASSGTTDVALFDRVVAGTPLPLGAWWDCEVTDGLNPATVLARFLEDLNALDRTHAGRDGIYTGGWFWDPQTAGSIPAHVERWPLWLSGYVADWNQVPVPAPWTREQVLLWQYTDNYNGTGIDASVFMGDDNAWAAWTGTQPNIDTSEDPVASLLEMDLSHGTARDLAWYANRLDVLQLMLNKAGEMIAGSEDLINPPRPPDARLDNIRKALADFQTKCGTGSGPGGKTPDLIIGPATAKALCELKKVT